jgi:hypothetical protein
METYLETKTSEFDGVCRGTCGYSSFAEIESDSVTGLKFWVETQFFPMSKDGTMVARPEGQHKWNNNEFPSAEPTETVLVLRYLNADSLTGKYEMSVDSEGNKTAPPIEWELGLLQLSAWDLWQLRMLRDEGMGWHDYDYSVGINEYHEQKEFYRMSSRARWTTNADLVKAVEADRLAPDFHPAVVIPEKGRVIRFAILKLEVEEEIEEVW